MKYTALPGPGNMTEYYVSPKGPNASGVPMDRVKKLLSPATKRKLASNNIQKTFGTQLDVLVRRSPPGCLIPLLVKKVVDFISRYGIDQEGIFRVNGNARTLEQLRYSFDQQGDAEIDEDCDVMAVAGLLKMFLRELPDTVIPEHMTPEFVALQQGNTDVASVVLLLMAVLKELPEENYNLLKYLCQFLVVVQHHEKDNKMSPMALAIVFGPNLFKCGEGIDGLRDQGITNQIVYKFITEYNTIFKLPHEDDPLLAWEKRYRLNAPPRPPPPKLPVSADDTLNLSSPRNAGYDVRLYSDEGDKRPLLPPGGEAHSSRGVWGPVSYEDHQDRCASPFISDSEGHSIIESPVVTARTNELVEKTISQTIAQHIFGDRSSNSVSPEKELASHTANGSGSDVNVPSLDSSEKSESESVKDRISKFEPDSRDETDAATHVRPTKQRPSSEAFDFFENKGIIISKAPKSTELKTSTEEDNGDLDDTNLGTVERQSEVLSTFKKPAGPPRRSPSRKFRRSLEESELEVEMNKLIQETTAVVPIEEPRPLPKPHPQPAPRKQPFRPRQVNSSSEDEDDLNQNNQNKSRITFLDIHHQEKQFKSSANISPDCSPLNNRKPMIPPLDLSILHEHVDSSDPIPALSTQMASLMRKPAPQDTTEDLENAVVVSPRSSKLKKRNGWAVLNDDDVKYEAPPSPSARTTFTDMSVALNTDIPPSPPVEQDQYKKHGPDDESSLKLRQLTKRIQLLKKRLKAFDENFEKEHGYRPSHGDKAAQPEVKKYMSDLSRARKELKKLKEEAEMGSRSRHGSGASSSGERADIIPTVPPTIEETLQSILRNLQEKRQDAHRPEELTMMGYEHVIDEKLAVQKALLHFESVHGRPRTKAEKDLMRPLYDRYRSIKRLLTKPTSPRNTIDLETVPEDQPMQILTGTTATSKFRNPIRVPTGSPDSDEVEGLGTMEFAVTRDFSVLRETGRPVDFGKNKIPQVKRVNSDDDDDEDCQTPDLNVNDLTIPELQDELQKAKGDKRRLRKLLRTFEEEFLAQNGRRVQKEDRSPMQGEYNQYKQAKAKLRLLEALLSKHHHQGFTDRV